ncbi:MAG: rod shape-determining protein [Bacillota bacterium]
MSFISGLFSRNIGIDLGTANTLIYAKGKGIILREPTVVAIQRKTGYVLSAGGEAQKMIGRTPEDILIVKPIRDGAISNFHATKTMLREFISRIYPRRSPFPLHAVVSVSLDVTEIEKRAVIEATRQAGAKTVYLVENSIAGAMGINLPIEDNSANMIVDIGGGTSEAAVIALGGIVSKNCLRLGGEQFNDAIIQYIRKKYNFLVGERTAEDIKIKIGSAYSSSQNQPMEVRGTDLVSRMPGKLSLNSREIANVLSEIIESIIKVIKKTLEETPVELMTDIMSKGIVMTGGGALLTGFPDIVEKTTRLPVSLAEHPLDSVALGTGKMLSSMTLLKKIT